MNNSTSLKQMPPHIYDLINTICSNEGISYSSIIDEIDSFLYNNHPKSQYLLQDILNQTLYPVKYETHDDIYFYISAARLNNVINKICGENGTTLKQIVNDINDDYQIHHPKNKTETQYLITVDVLKKLKNTNLHKRAQIPSWVLDALHRRYNINPDYIIGNSDSMFDEAGITYKCFSKIFPEWKTVNASFIDENNIPHTDQYLLLTTNSHLYEFLKQADSARYTTSEGMIRFNQNLKEYEKEFNNKNDSQYKEYVLLPTEDLDKILLNSIAQDKSLPRGMGFDDVIDCANYYSFLYRERISPFTGCQSSDLTAEENSITKS